MIRRFCLISMVLTAACTGWRAADVSAQSSKQVPVVQITSRPQPEPTPALKYSLVPAIHKMMPGNAAPLYYRAILMLPRGKEEQLGTKHLEWLELPLEELPTEEVHEWLGAYHSVFGEIQKATYREYCHWDRRPRDLQEIAVLLPEIQKGRTIARVLRIKLQLEIAEKRFDDANETLVMGYRLAASISESPYLVSFLVGVATASMMNDGVEEWIRQGGPNLYWALAELPDPFVDARTAIQHELFFPIQMVPVLRNPESLNMSPRQWRSELSETFQLMANFADDTDEEPWKSQLAATGLIFMNYPAAKKALIQSGMDPDQVEAMPAGQVVAIESSRAYHRTCHETLKWTYLPYWQAQRQMRASKEKRQTEGNLIGPGAVLSALPVAAMMLPAIDAVTLATVRFQREIRALQTIEALRMGAANSGGQLPATLEILEQCPAPIDPVTGNQILYRVEKGTGILELPPPEGKHGSLYGKRYELRLK